MESLNPYAPPQAAIFAPPPLSGNADEEIRRTHIKAESTARTVGILYYLGAFLLTGVAVLGIANGQLARGDAWMGLGLCLFLGLGQGFLAYGLRRLKGWARIPTIILSCIGLLGFPLGTLINGVILSNICGAKGVMIFSPDYKRIIAVTPHVKNKTSKAALIVLILLLAVLALCIGGAVLSSRS